MIASSVLILIYLTAGITSDSPCGDWKAYKDEKCLKIFDSAGLLDYESAKTFCEEQDDSQLLSIDLGKKQKFIESFLKLNSVVDNVWIGLHYVNNTYKWADSSKFGYTNWVKGNLTNNASPCVQIQTEFSNFGLWSNESCSKKNLVICEKIQKWSLTQLQTEVMNLRKDAVPVGFIYVHLPNQQAPAAIWPDAEWENITPHYKGVFFRAAGGNAAPFGEVQEPDSPRLINMNVDEFNISSSYTNMPVEANGEPSKALSIRGNKDYFTGWGMQVTVSNAEVRPQNMAIRIWKRTA